MLSFFRKIGPGLLLCIILAIPAWLLGQAFPVIGGPVFAILLGIVVGMVLNRKAGSYSGLQAGITFTSKKILQYAVVLLGFGLNLSQIAQVGATSLPIIASTIATSLIIAFVLYRLLKIPKNSATLVGVGSSICGGSAIACPGDWGRRRGNRPVDFGDFPVQCTSGVAVPHSGRHDGPDKRRIRAVCRYRH